QFFARPGDNLPPELAMAIIEMPAEFSGVPKSWHDLLIGRALQAQYGPEIAEISELEEAAAIASSTAEAVWTEVRPECGVQDETVFNSLAAPAEQSDKALWFRRRKNT